MNRTNHLSLLCDIGELDWIFHDTESIDGFLQNIVDLVARHLEAAVCSIYLYSEDNHELILKATRGLNPSLIGEVRLQYGEGITGLAVKEMRPILDNHASSNPRYKFFSGLMEEQFDSFCVAPLLRGIRRIGALVVQRERHHPFSQADVSALQVVAGQLANIIENTRLLSSLKTKNAPEPDDDKGPLPPMVKGRGASAGFAFGPAFARKQSSSLEDLTHKPTKRPLHPGDFERALRDTSTHLEELQHRVEERLADGASLIFTAHLLLLKDEQFSGRMRTLIRNGMEPVEAIVSVARHVIRSMACVDNEYIRERTDDIKDLAIRLIEACDGSPLTESTPRDHILVSNTILPSELLVMAAEGIRGIIMIGGGETSHTAILARSLGIPICITDERRLLDCPEGTQVLIDGDGGNIFISPSEAVISPYREREETRRRQTEADLSLSTEILTSDGEPLRVFANVNLLSDAETAESLSFQGIGLYRTEFPFLIRSTFPTEEEQVVIYRKLVERMPGKPITFRTLDIGGDKVLSYYHSRHEANPFLGMRSIRFALHNTTMFRQQIRAILRAGCDASLGIMFPMICSLEEFIEARRLVDECVKELASQKITHHTAPAVGVMIELPATVQMADELARHADFFSIGTNDLVQYILGVDRTNEKVAHLYIPHHPAVLRSIAQIADRANAAGIPVSICGDMGQNPAYLPFLIGMGIRSFSIDPVSLHRMLPAFSSCNAGTAVDRARKCLSAATSVQTAEILGLERP